MSPCRRHPTRASHVRAVATGDVSSRGRSACQPENQPDAKYDEQHFRHILEAEQRREAAGGHP